MAVAYCAPQATPCVRTAWSCKRCVRGPRCTHTNNKYEISKQFHIMAPSCHAAVPHGLAWAPSGAATTAADALTE
eukprot:5564894-Pleurochrysis_carterae.AAC.1